MPKNVIPPLQEVLYEFSEELIKDKATLEHYLDQFPQYAEALVDFSFELSKPEEHDDAPWSAEELAEINAAWAVRTKIVSVVEDPFKNLSVDRMREISQALDVPRTVILGFRERLVDVASVPMRFLNKLAMELGQSIEQYLAYANCGAPVIAGRRFKSDKPPEVSGQITFEQLLVQTGVPEEKRIQLLEE